MVPLRRVMSLEFCCWMWEEACLAGICGRQGSNGSIHFMVHHEPCLVPGAMGLSVTGEWWWWDDTKYFPSSHPIGEAIGGQLDRPCKATNDRQISNSMIHLHPHTTLTLDPYLDPRDLAIEKAQTGAPPETPLASHNHSLPMVPFIWCSSPLASCKPA